MAKQSPTKEELWLPAFGLIACGYEVSNLGRVRSWRASKLQDEPRILSPCDNSKGYPSVSLYIHDGSKHRRRYTVHRVVACTFMCPVGEREQINHKDGNKRNAQLQNLEFCTPSENNYHAKDTGLNNDRGANSVLAKFNESQVRQIRMMRDSGASYSLIMERFPMAKSTCSYICNNRTYR